MCVIVFSARADKALRKYRKSGRFPHEKFQTALTHLRAGKPLPQSFRDHQLKGDLSIFRELHLADDVLVQYRRNDELRVVVVDKIGTHTELFGE